MKNSKKYKYGGGEVKPRNRVLKPKFVKKTSNRAMEGNNSNHNDNINMNLNSSTAILV